MKSKANDKSKYAAWIDPHEVKPYEKNAKIHDKKQVKNIVNSIRRFGWQQDVVITSDKVLVIGHGRRLAANGLQLYNDLVLVEPIGTAAIRAPGQFKQWRKVVKTHQNILVFYKGNMQAIKENFREIEVAEIE